jgi:starch phosphorylase
VAGPDSSRSYELSTRKRDIATPAAAPVADAVSDSVYARYGISPGRFAGSDGGMYEHHLVSDKAINPRSARPRDRFEAFARSVRDVLARRWALTTETYLSQNPKLVY